MSAPAVILIVDDEEPVANALERALRPDGYTLLKATDPVEALEVVRREHVDLVISDHLMPGMKGLDFLREVKQIRPETLRVLLTGHADMQLAIAAINQGEVYRFFQKPWDDATLRFDIGVALKNRRLESENRELSQKISDQEAMLRDLEQRFPGISEVKRTATGAIVIDDEDL